MDRGWKKKKTFTSKEVKRTVCTQNLSRRKEKGTLVTFFLLSFRWNCFLNKVATLKIHILKDLGWVPGQAKFYICICWCLHYYHLKVMLSPFFKPHLKLQDQRPMPWPKKVFIIIFLDFLIILDSFWPIWTNLFPFWHIWANLANLFFC